MENITVQRVAEGKPKPIDENKLGFGSVFTDHMFIVNYAEGKGWHNPRIVPHQPLSLDPAVMCLHYGQTVFEGMKAYRGVDSKIRLFRPEENFRRLNTSNERLCMPVLDEDMLLQSLEMLVDIDRDWVPSAENTSLYIRPFIIATEPKLGVKTSAEYIYMVIMSPSGPYYPEGLNPIKIYVENTYVRAVKGGIGTAKTGGNYAASLKAQEEAHEQNYSQVLWLDGIHRRFIEEVGAMNIFFVIDGRVVTPALNGSILSGITRKSVIELLRSWNIPVEERAVSIDEIIEAAASGKLDEVFGTGTAAVVSPVGELRYGDARTAINNGVIGAVSQRLYDELTGIQWGRIADTFGWTKEV